VAGLLALAAVVQQQQLVTYRGQTHQKLSGA